jgi:ABC-type glycerol-3-phosphate transport system substrate-binding protein
MGEDRMIFERKAVPNAPAGGASALPSHRSSRLRLRAGAGVMAAAALLAACGSSTHNSTATTTAAGPTTTASSSSSSSSGAAAGSGSTTTAAAGGATATITAWIVDGGNSTNGVFDSAIKSFEASHPGDKVEATYVNNSSFKQKIQLAMGAGNPPTIFFTWGGGPLQSYINAGDVYGLGNPSWAQQFLPSSLGAVTYKGQLWGVPEQGTQPVFFYYNKSVLSKAGISSFPTTWNDLLADVATLKKAGVYPIALGNQSGWEGLMYLEYLTDRIGGPGVFKSIESGGSWNNPAIISALTMIQQLVKAGAFQPGYNSQDFSTNGPDTLVATGKAAMQLMGDWDLSSLLNVSKSFVSTSTLGQGAFPSVPNGTGDPKDLAGNTTSYAAIANKATAAQKAVAESFLSSQMTSSSYAQALVGIGQVPVVTGSSQYLASSSIAPYLQDIYNDVRSAPSFQYSWDQSLPPAEVQPMLTNLEQVFEMTETPQAFVSALDAVKP